MDLLQRFSHRERLLHWMTALAFFILAGTGWLIWRHEDDLELFGVNVVSQSHVWMGGALLVAAGFIYALRRRDALPAKEKRFKTLQVMSLRFAQAGLAVMILSGTVMYLGLTHVIAVSRPIRKLITEIHFDASVALVAFLVIHFAMVFLSPKNRGILRGMVTGSIERNVARRASPQWLAELEAPSAGSPAKASKGRPEGRKQRQSLTGPRLR